MPDRPVDLRSDTLTRPTPEMRRAMAEADVGDDVYGEDPTVNALQEAFAERVGKPAALYFPSGVMANQVAIRVHSTPGSVAVAGARQHVVIYENGAAGRNAGIQFTTVDDTHGWWDAAALADAVEAADHHYPRPGLVCVEDTHMPAGGVPWPVDRLATVKEIADAATVPVHMDGARLFHAEVATGVSAAARAGHATTVMCCLSKGLCAPVGSMLAGPDDVIAAARVERARMGGGMRQAGVIAAAGLVALSMVERLAEDHDRAKVLASAVQEHWPDAMAGDPLTNVVVFRHDDPTALLAHLEGEGVLAGTIAPRVIRLVTHHDIDDAAVERARSAIASAP